MAKANILVLYNQPILPRDHPDAESEHTVVAVAQCLARILHAAGYSATPLGLLADPTTLWNELQARQPDAIVNLFEGNPDRPETESYVAGLLEWAGIPFTGSPSETLTVARSKHLTKYLLKGAGIPTADFIVLEKLPAPTCPLPFPVIAKPGGQDASVGVHQNSVCTSLAALDDRVKHLFAAYGPPVLIEQYISGRELNVAVLELPELSTLAPMEIVFPEKADSWPIYTYERKWLENPEGEGVKRTLALAGLTDTALADLNQLACKVYRLLGCRDYARVDFRLTPSGEPFVLEVNPNPDISEEADLTACLPSVGWTHSGFVVRLVEQALAKKRSNSNT